jgi:hypothetical protein
MLYSLAALFNKPQINPSMYVKRFECEIYHCHYEISGYHTNELSSVNTLYERKL